MEDFSRKLVIKELRNIGEQIGMVGFPPSVTNMDAGAMANLSAAKELIEIARFRLGDICPECGSVVTVYGKCPAKCQKLREDF